MFLNENYKLIKKYNTYIMSNFEVIIDYTYKLDDSNLIGEGMRGKVYKYTHVGSDYIIKYDNSMGTIESRPKYSEFSQLVKPFESSNVPENEFTPVEKKQNHYFTMSSVVNQLDHFVKIKGFVIFPNLIWKRFLTENMIFCSCLYENVGSLQRGVLPLDKDLGIQLYEIFDSFRKFNLAGYFHDDIQGCNNIEYKSNGELYVLDYDVNKFNDDNPISLQKILADLSHMYTCIMRYMSNDTIINDTEGSKQLAFYLMKEYLKTKPTIMDKNNSELPIKNSNGFYYQETPIRKNISDLKKILSTGYNLGIFYNYANADILKDLQGYFDDFSNDLKSIKSINVDIDNFKRLLENYIDNYYVIIGFLEKIQANKNLSKDEKELVSNISSLFHTITLSSILLFIGDTEIYFRDVKPILNSLYLKQINDFKNLINNKYREKYLKYKAKYLKLKKN